MFRNQVSTFARMLVDVELFGGCNIQTSLCAVRYRRHNMESSRAAFPSRVCHGGGQTGQLYCWDSGVLSLAMSDVVCMLWFNDSVVRL